MCKASPAPSDCGVGTKGCHLHRHLLLLILLSSSSFGKNMAIQSMVSEAVCQGVLSIIVSALPLTSHITLSSLYLSLSAFNLVEAPLS